MVTNVILPKKPRKAPARIFYVHVQNDLARAGAPTEILLADLNALVEARGGIVLADGQLLAQRLEPDCVLDRFFDDENTSDWHHPMRPWGPEQAAYFGGLLGAASAFQYGERPEEYGRYCLGLRVPGPYLSTNERILGLIDAGRDDRSFYCPCHYAEVVYTTAHRLVCMMCGQMHCVLSGHLSGVRGNGWSWQEWDAAFDADGVLLSDELEIPFIEYQEVFGAEKLWETDAWHNASGDIEFLERGDPEDVERWRRGQPTAEDFLEAGWSQLPLALAPARQIEPEGIGLSPVDNAIAAVNGGAKSYGASDTDAAPLREAVLSTFQAAELLLRMRLDMLGTGQSVQRLPVPAVVTALESAGIYLTPDEHKTLEAMRLLRNQLQHSGARYGFRATRSLLERAFLFIDRFTSEEFDWWLGEVVEQPAWDALLRIEPIRRRAMLQADAIVAVAITDRLNSLESCPHCGHCTVVREQSRAGFCVYCRRIPVRPPPCDYQ
jgi:hypothetical protein